MTKIDGGELFVRTIKQEGVNEIFTLHGGHLDAIFQACLDHNIRMIDTRHEASAGHAAEGFSRSTGRLAVAIVTAGPGFTNVVTSMVNAYLDGIPVLYVAGAPPLRDAEVNPLQGGFDQVAMSTCVTKWAHRITQTHRIPNLVAHAIRTATTGRPGPVFLEIPIDVLFSQVNAEAVKIPRTITVKAPPGPTPEAVSAAIDLLLGAERPAIMAGGGAWFSGGGDELLAFAERTGIPVYANTRGQGLVPGDHPLFGGTFPNMAVLQELGEGRPDVLLILGARLGMWTGGLTDTIVPDDARLIHVDIDGREIGRLRDVAVPIVADCRQTVIALDAAAADHQWPDYSAWQETVRKAATAHRQQFADVLENTSPPIHPYQAVTTVIDCMDKDAILVADGGEVFSWVETVARPRHGGSFLSAGYLGCLGTGQGLAIGARIAHPERQVVCVTGDGAVGLNIQEFDTMVRHELPIVTVVLNNQSWGMSLHGQDIMFGRNRLAVTELAATRYDDVAAAFGCHGELVENIDDLAPAMERAFASGKPACVNVMTDKWAVAPFTLALLGTWDKESQIALPYYENIEAG